MTSARKNFRLLGSTTGGLKMKSGFKIVRGICKTFHENQCKIFEFSRKTLSITVKFMPF